MFLSIGILSGTSSDGIDVAVVNSAAVSPKIIFGETFKYSKQISLLLKKIPDIELPEVAILDKKIGEEFAKAVNTLLKLSGINRKRIKVIGSHGQTLFHIPKKSSLQIGSPAVIAKLTGIPVAAQFRMDDIALGGEGAPLTPLLDLLILGKSSRKKKIAALNLGGIANISVISNGKIESAYDIGPANSLIDAACRRLLGQAFDRNGVIASKGKIDEAWIASALRHQYFKIKPPKSTGIESFGECWLENIGFFKHNIPPADAIATLTEFTARSIARDISRYNLQKVFVSGGGLKNTFLMKRLETLTKINFVSFETLGIDPDLKEAVLFAYLGEMRLLKKELNLQNITGCKRKCVLGGLWQP